MPSPEEILAGFEEGKPGSRRLGLLARQVSYIRADGAWGNVLSALCLLDGPAILTFLGRLFPAAAPARDPRGFESLCDAVDALRTSRVPCRPEPRGTRWEDDLGREALRGIVRNRLGLAGGAWNEAAEAEARRMHEAREQPFVLVPFDGPAPAGAPQILAALAANAALAEASRERSADLLARREAVLARRVG